VQRQEIKKRNIIQLLTAIIIIVLVNIAGSFQFWRLDLTTEKRYTLSPLTKQFLGNINEDISVQIYLEGDDLPFRFRRMRNAIKELLDEFGQYSSANIAYEFINPTENPDKKVRFAIYKELHDLGIIPVEADDAAGDASKMEKKMVFPGVVIAYHGRQIGVQLLKKDAHYKPDAEENINNSIQSLEYEFTNALRKLLLNEKPVIAFIEGHGELNEYQVMDVTRGLSEYYSVVRGKINGRLHILDKYAAIIIAKPHFAFDEKDKFVIDQYIMKGGKVLWLVDGVNAEMDSLGELNMMIAMANNLNLDDQLFKYGVRINPVLVQDMQCAPIGLMINDEAGKPAINFYAWPYFPIFLSDNNHHINKYLNIVKAEFISSLDTVGASAKVKKTILLRSSKYTRVMRTPVQITLELLQSKPDVRAYNQPPVPVAVLLEGEFESVFKNRMVPNMVIPVNDFVDKSSHTKQIVIGDGDMIKNEVNEKGEPYPLGFDRRTQRNYGGNRELILNAINYLCDDEGLMSVRSREIKLRRLDQNLIIEQRTFWQIINVLAPVLLISIFGIAMIVYRKKKYSS